ncbi:MAG: hypothetical protein DRJ10_10280 [Bacteroidetes bacterium]|nr:MAG: hypothetical protein DRJ10_10280 [Bacteroidota bacterium]
MKHLILLTIFSTVLILSSCTQSKIKENLLPGISGSAGEVLLVIDKKHYDDSIGQAFKRLLQEDTPGLPQSEPLFNLIHIPRKAMSRLFRIHRNIVVTNISNQIEKPGIKVEYDKWAKPQTIITMVAPNAESFLELYDRNSQKILGLLYKAEKDRLTKNYKTYSEKKLITKLEKRTGVHLTIPKGYTYDLDTNNFIWISHETPDISQGIFVYYYDYTDTIDFSTNSLINKRNEILKSYVSGDGTNTFMTTELQIFPLFRSYKLNGKYTAELRGLWKVEGNFMGGPFVSISQLDEKNNRIVTVEGYVYAPKYRKRKYVRQLEAILYSIEFVEE